MEKRFKWRIFVIMLVSLIGVITSKVVVMAAHTGTGFCWEALCYYNYAADPRGDANPNLNYSFNEDIVRKDGYVTYVEKRDPITWSEDAVSKDEPARIGQLLYSGKDRVLGGNYYDNIGGTGTLYPYPFFGTHNYSYTDSEGKLKNDTKPLYWERQPSQVYFWPQTTDAKDMWGYVQEPVTNGEKKAIFLQKNDSVDPGSTEASEGMDNIEKWYGGNGQGDVSLDPTGQGLYPSNKIHRNVRVKLDDVSQKGLIPGEEFTFSVKIVETDNLNKCKEFIKGMFNLENCDWNGDWEKDGDWVKCKIRVNNNVDQNKIRITANYAYTNYYAKAYVFAQYYHHKIDGPTQTGLYLYDPIEGAQGVNRRIYIEIPLRCNVKINQYISKIDGQANPDYIQKNGSEWQLQTRF